jgi:hypothetical protein
MPSQTDVAITLEQAKEALRRSGYLLESRVADRLEKIGYYVQTNDAYVDPVTAKSRELDLYAMGANKLSRKLDYIFPVLVIECVNNPQPLVLLSKDPKIGFLFHEDFKLAGLPAKIRPSITSKEWVTLTDYLHMEKYLHFCSGRVATQFCSFNFTKDKWIALHESPQFDAFQKLCDATDYYVRTQYLRYTPSIKDSINIEFYYPILIIQGQLIEGRTTGNKLNLRKVNHLCFRRTLIRNGKDETYNIDVVTEGGLPGLVKQIEAEMEKATQQIKRKKAIFAQSIDAIYEQTRRLRSKEKIAAALHL